MQKFLIPAALALAVTASGSAFADTATESIDTSIYSESSLFVTSEAPAGTGIDYLRMAKRGAQRASTAPMPAESWEQDAETSQRQLYLPE